MTKKADSIIHHSVVQGRDHHIEVGTHGNDLSLRVSGYLNEDVNFQKLFELVDSRCSSAKRLLIDLGSVARMNSIGVREWISFIRKLPRLTLEFISISEPFLQQGVIVPQLLGGRRPLIRSFEAPFQCSHCNIRSIRKLSPEDIVRDGLGTSAPCPPCDRCGNALSFDAIEDEYFFFLSMNPAKAAA